MFELIASRLYPRVLHDRRLLFQQRRSNWPKKALTEQMITKYWMLNSGSNASYRNPAITATKQNHLSFNTVSQRSCLLSFDKGLYTNMTVAKYFLCWLRTVHVKNKTPHARGHKQHQLHLSIFLDTSIKRPHYSGISWANNIRKVLSSGANHLLK